MKKILLACVSIAVTSAAMVGAARSEESMFLKTLAGSWSGKGTVKVRASSPTMNVTCKFKSNTTASSIALDGRCTSLAVFSRVITADLKTNGSAYTGFYVGAGTGTAELNGSRAGDAIKLDVRWAKEVNGDRRALLTIERMGPSGMRLTTVDADPATGQSIVTSQIDLRRN